MAALFVKVQLLSDDVAPLKDSAVLQIPNILLSWSASTHLRWSCDINKLNSKYVKINSQKAVHNSENLT